MPRGATDGCCCAHAYYTGTVYGDGAVRYTLQSGKLLKGSSYEPDRALSGRCVLVFDEMCLLYKVKP